jgi:hypothetical protein
MRKLLILLAICLGCGKGVDKNLPDDIPAYPQSTVQNAVATPTGKLLNLTTGDAYTKVLDVYPKMLEERGWTTIVNRERAGGMIIAKKTDRECHISCYNEKNHTRISVTIEHK